MQTFSVLLVLGVSAVAMATPAVADKAAIQFRINYGKVNTRRVVDLSHQLCCINIDYDHVRAMRYIQSPGGAIYGGMIPSFIASNRDRLQETVTGNGRGCHGDSTHAQHKQYGKAIRKMFALALSFSVDAAHEGFDHFRNHGCLTWSGIFRKFAILNNIS